MSKVEEIVGYYVSGHVSQRRLFGMCKGLDDGL